MLFYSGKKEETNTHQNLKWEWKESIEYQTSALRPEKKSNYVWVDPYVTFQMLFYTKVLHTHNLGVDSFVTTHISCGLFAERSELK